MHHDDVDMKFTLSCLTLVEDGSFGALHLEAQGAGIAQQIGAEWLEFNSFGAAHEHVCPSRASSSLIVRVTKDWEKIVLSGGAVDAAKLGDFEQLNNPLTVLERRTASHVF